MEEPYGEGLASRTGPESCADSRKAGREALTGVHAGGVLSRVITGNQGADVVGMAEGNTGEGDTASTLWTLRGRRPPTSMEPSCARTGRP
jgi:hypothetical protein